MPTIDSINNLDLLLIMDVPSSALAKLASLARHQYASILSGLILGFLVFTFSAHFSRLNIDVHHQGIMYSAAARVLDGDKIYSGNSYYYGPIVPILNALGLLIFGRHLLVLQVMSAACYGFIAVLLWRIWARFLKLWTSWVMVLLSFLLAPFLFWEFLPWSSIYSLVFLLLSLLEIIRWVESEEQLQLGLAGIFASLAFWARQSVGIPLGILSFLLLLFLCIYLQKATKYLVISLVQYAAGALIVLLFGCVLLRLNHSLVAWFRACIQSRLEWAVNVSGAHVGFQQVLTTVALCLFDGFKLSLWFYLPVAAFCVFIRLFIVMIEPSQLRSKRTASLFAYVTVCLISWIQYYPVSDPRHHFWAALPLFAITVILFWSVSVDRITPLTRKHLYRLTLPIRMMVIGVPTLAVAMFALTFYPEARQRLYSGLPTGTIDLHPAWQRQRIYDTPFFNPPVLQGMLGARSQVDSLSRLYDKIEFYIAVHPFSYMISTSGWDLLSANYLDRSSEIRFKNSKLRQAPLLLSDSSVPPAGYLLLTHEVIDPAFGYQATAPGHYYLYSPAEKSVP